MTSGTASYAITIAERTARDPFTRVLRPDWLVGPGARSGPGTAGAPGTTGTAHRRARTAAAPRGIGIPWPRALTASRVGVIAGTVALAVLSVVLRAWHQTSAFETFIDEVEYADTANSFAAGLGPLQFGEPFFLHPALPFWLLGLTIEHPVPHMTIDVVLGLRDRMLVFGALNCVLVVAVCRRVVGPWAALLAGLLYALDPFVVRFDSRVMLEAPMMAAVLGGVLAALVAVEARDARRRWAWLVVAGVVFGVAICTKTTSALITTGPLLLMAVTGWGLRRREAVATIAVQCACYLAYFGWIVQSGYFRPWFEYTIAGTFRAVGVVKETGFNSGNSPSFVSRALAQAELFGPSYLLIGAGVCFTLFLLVIGWRSLGVGRRRARHARRGGGEALSLLLCWLVGVLGGVLYTFGFAEIEEQTFYQLAVPATIVVALLASWTASWGMVGHTALTVIVTLVLVASGSIWWSLHSRPDDVYRTFSDFAYSRLEPGARIALGDQVAQFVLPGFDVNELRSLDEARRDGYRYALVSTELTRLGFAPAKQPVLDELRAGYLPVFTGHGRTIGELVLYDLAQPLPAPAPPAAAGVPAVGAPIVPAS